MPNSKVSQDHTLILLVLLMYAQFAYGKYAVELAGLKVVLPQDARKTMSMAMADFGLPKYGGILKGNLVYPTSESGYPNGGLVCKPEGCQFGCSRLNESTPQFLLKRQPGMLNIVMLNRGPRAEGHHPCFFIDKVWNAQLAGADAVLIANDEPGEMSTAVAPDDQKSEQEMHELSVSAALISQEDGAYLKALLRRGPVTLALNWSSSLPQAAVVDVEWWTNSNDECGPLCDDQVRFIKEMKPNAQALIASGALRFTPHYLLWSCPEEFRNTTQCQTECIVNGTYCSPDPDDDPKAGYTGRDVLMMNMRQLCFHQVASAAGKGALWWDFVTAINSNCTTAKKTFGYECALDIFLRMGGNDWVPGGKGRETWDACMWFNETDTAEKFKRGDINGTKVALLESEMLAQAGTASGQAAVTILPTVRINGHQYRGAMVVSEVMRAICSAFPSGKEPQVCTARWVSEDECEAGGAGDRACRASDKHNKCVNTFRGYSCECQGGWMKVTNPDTGEERCEDVNECLATNIPLENPACACERCACINSPGTYKCTGPLPAVCTKENNWAGCWHADAPDANGETVHACMEVLADFKALAARGLANMSTPYSTCRCPACYSLGSGGKGCVAACNASQCDKVAGMCMGGGSAQDVQPPGSGGAPSGGGSGSNSSSRSSSSGGMSGWGVMLLVLLTAVGTGGAFMLAHKYLLTQRMTGEIRDIMAQYMPLDEERRRTGGTGGGGGMRGGGGGVGASGRGGRGDRAGLMSGQDDDDEEEGMYGWAQPSGAAGAYGWTDEPTTTSAASKPTAQHSATAGTGAAASSAMFGGGGGGGGAWGAAVAGAAIGSGAGSGDDGLRLDGGGSGRPGPWGPLSTGHGPSSQPATSSSSTKRTSTGGSAGGLSLFGSAGDVLAGSGTGTQQHGTALVNANALVGQGSGLAAGLGPSASTSASGPLLGGGSDPLLGLLLDVDSPARK